MVCKYCGSKRIIKKGRGYVCDLCGAPCEEEPKNKSLYFDVFKKHLKVYKTKSQQKIKESLFKTINELNPEIDDDLKHFCYFMPLILAFADSRATQIEMDLVNEINYKCEFGHRKVSLDVDPSEFKEYLEENLKKFFSYVGVYKSEDFHLSYFMEKYKLMVEYMVACLAYKGSISEEELEFLGGITGEELTGYDLSFECDWANQTSSKESEKQPAKENNSEQKKTPRKAEKAKKKIPERTIFVAVVNKIITIDIPRSKLELIGVYKTYEMAEAKVREYFKKCCGLRYVRPGADVNYTVTSSLDFPQRATVEVIECDVTSEKFIPFVAENEIGEKSHPRLYKGFSKIAFDSYQEVKAELMELDGQPDVLVQPNKMVVYFYKNNKPYKVIQFVNISKN